MRRKIKLFASPFILAATAVLFAWYVARHHSLIHQLAHTSPTTVALLLVLYAAWFFALLLVLQLSMRVYGKQLHIRELFLLNAYSSLLNFFGPGQSGPAVRGAYLKRRHGVGVKQYVFTTLLYYGFFAVMSALFLFAGVLPWWQTALLVAGAGACSYGVIRRFARRSHIGERQAGLNIANLSWIFVATACQACLQVAIYAVELRSINPHIAIGQSITYTGAANFAMYVSLTPGAIGIRESFLLFSRHLHHIGTADIVSANFIDRAVYLLLLAVLAVFVLGLHAKQTLHIKSAGQTDEDTQ